MKFSYAKRISVLPRYLFAEIDMLKQREINRGADIISLGIGDPDLPTPQAVIAELSRAAQDEKNHHYPSYNGMPLFRQAVADWYSRRFDVRLNAGNEVLTLIGSKEGIGHIILAFVDPGDYVLIPDPGYPVYKAGTILADGIPYFMPLLRENGFLPDFSKIPESVLEKAKIMFLNYPNNPTAAVADYSFFRSAVEVARRYNILICHDAAYSEIYFDGERPISFMQVPGAKEVGIEFHSLSKTYNMTGWRIGFAVGNPSALNGLGKVKENLDSGVFRAIQYAGIAALNLPDSVLDGIRTTYQVRRDIIVKALNDINLSTRNPKATFYVWVRVPDGYNSKSFVLKLLKEAALVTTPGSGLGASGEGYIRIALTTNAKRLKEAAKRIENLEL